MREQVSTELAESARLMQWAADNLSEGITRSAQVVIEAYRQGGKVLFCGNGGSAADSQHLACELVWRLRVDRPALPAIALTTNTSTLTAVGNDRSFDELFLRQVEALASPGDVLIAISTSGNSRNVKEAVCRAKEKRATTIGLLGKNGGRIAKLVDIPLVVKSDNSQRVQECHIAIGHIICALVEKELFS